MTLSLDIESVAKSIDWVPGYLHFDEGVALMRWAMEWSVAGLTVELGAMFGRSTAFLAKGCQMSGNNHQVWTFDHFRGSSEHQAGGEAAVQDIVDGKSILVSFIRNMRSLGLLCTVTPILMDHVQGVTEIEKEDGGKVRLLFIDGEHDYDSTKRNFEAWRPKMAAGGLVVFHDDDKNHKDVQRFVQELTAYDQYRRLENVKSLAAFVMPS